jgi:hypothetical protein
MPYVRDSFWRAREWTSLPQMQRAALAWCREVAGRRSCRPLGGASPLSVFTAVEAEELIPLPCRGFVLADWSRGTVGPDIHVNAGRTLYSVPWRHIGRKVDMRSTGGPARPSPRRRAARLLPCERAGPRRVRGRGRRSPNGYRHRRGQPADQARRIARMTRGGRVSAGGATRLLAARDGWCAITLSRPDDVAAVPALLQVDEAPVDPWPALRHWAATHPVSAVGVGQSFGVGQIFVPTGPCNSVTGAPRKGPRCRGCWPTC